MSHILCYGAVYYTVQGGQEIRIFEFVDEIVKCDHSIESYRAVLSCGTVSYAVQDVLTFKSVDETLNYKRSNESYRKVLYRTVVLFVMLYKVVITFKSVDKILTCYRSNESY